MWKQLVSLFILFCQLASIPTHPFQANIKTKDRTKIEFLVDFDVQEILVSESTINCLNNNHCRLKSSTVYTDTYNNTKIEFLEAELELFFENGVSAIFEVRLTKGHLNVLGVHPQSVWKKTLGNLFMHIDCWSGRTSLETTEPKAMILLDIEEDKSRFYKKARISTEWERRSGYRAEYSIAPVKLQFPSAIDYFQGNYFFMMKKRDLIGWDGFLKTLVDGFSQYEVRYAVLMGNDYITFDNHVFANYDKDPFKELPELFTKEDFTIGRFFVAKSQLQLILSQSSKDSEMRAGILVTDHTYVYGLHINLVVLIQVLVLVGLLFAGIMWVGYCIPFPRKRSSSCEYMSI